MEGLRSISSRCQLISNHGQILTELYSAERQDIVADPLLCQTTLIYTFQCLEIVVNSGNELFCGRESCTIIERYLELFQKRKQVGFDQARAVSAA